MAKRINSPEAAKLLGTRIRSERNLLGITLNELASRAKMHHSQLSRIERGAAITLSSNVLNICTLLKIPIDCYTSQQAETSGLGQRIERLVAIAPECAPVISRFIDAIEGLVSDKNA